MKTINKKVFILMLVMIVVGLKCRGMDVRENFVSALYEMEYDTVDSILKNNDYKCLEKDVISNDSFKSTPLHIVFTSRLPCRNKEKLSNQIKIVKRLIDEGASLQSKNINGSTPLHKAVFSGHPKIVALLINNGANVNAKNDESDYTPLLALTSTRIVWNDLSFHKKIIELLAGNGADVNAKDKDGNTSLHFAAKKDNLEIMKVLLLNDAKIDVKNKNNETPLNLLSKKRSTMLEEWHKNNYHQS